MYCSSSRLVMDTQTSEFFYTPNYLSEFYQIYLLYYNLGFDHNATNESNASSDFDISINSSHGNNSIHGLMQFCHDFYIVPKFCTLNELVQLVQQFTHSEIKQNGQTQMEITFETFIE
jgi:hypothetical protein